MCEVPPSALLRGDWPDVPDDGVSPEWRAEAALENLADAGDAAIQLSEAIRRGRGQVVYTSPGATLMRMEDANQMLIAPDLDEGRRIFCAIEPTFMTLCTMGLMDEICAHFEFTHFMRHHLALYESTEPIPVDPALAEHIMPLDSSWAPTVSQIYSHGFSPEEIAGEMSMGTLFGAFDPEDGELVGFIGEHTEGAIGILEIRDFYRRRGWAEALEATKVNEHLSRGWLPWCQIDEGNEASIALQKKLGFRMTPPEQVFLW